MPVRQTIVTTSFFLILALFSVITRDVAGAEERWPPWQSFTEAEEAARQKELKRRAAAANSLSSLKRQVTQLSTAGKYAQAVPVAQRVLALSERKGAQSLEVADALDVLAGLYEAQSKFAEAEPLLKRSLAIREKAPGQPNLAATRGRLATTYDKLGRTADAEVLRAGDVLAKKSGGGAAAPMDEKDTAAHAEAAKAEAAKAEAARAAAQKAEAERSQAAEQYRVESNGQAMVKKIEEPFVMPPADGPSGGAAPPTAEAAPEPAQEKSAEAPFSIPPADGPSGGAAPSGGEVREALKPKVPKFGARGLMRRGSPGTVEVEPPSAAAEAPPPEAVVPEPMPQAPGSAEGGSGAPPDVASEPGAPAPPDDAMVGAAPPPALDAAPSGGGGGPSAAAPAPPPPAKVDAAPKPVTPAALKAAPPAANPDWQVVPVYWGTDRAVQPNAQRLAFGSDRARKLQLGVADITVPKSHEVPNVERPWVLKVPYFDVTLYAESEDPKRHFTVKDIKALTKEELLAQVKERLKTSTAFKDQALVFIHGYNTSFDNALYRTAQIAYDLGFDGAPFLYSWPSGGAVASYTYDRESAQASEPYLRQFLEMVAKETGAKQVSIIAHSMGNQPLMDVLRDMKSAAREGVVISQVILAAPDVDADSFSNLAQTIKGLASNVTLYVASNDRALIVSRNFWGSYRAGDVPPAGPLVLPGIDTIDVTAASTDVFAINHSGYAANNKLLGDIGELLKSGLRPPEMRALKPGKITGQAGDYWRYAPPQ